MVDLTLGAIIVFVAGCFVGGSLAMLLGQRKQIEIMTNLIQYGRPTTPTVGVYDPGPSDPEEQATIKLREREVDALQRYLESEGVDRDKALAEAGRLLRYADGGT